MPQLTKRSVTTLTLAAAVGLAVATAPSLIPSLAQADDATPAAGDAEAGAQVYATYCVACHQADGTGMGGMLGANFKGDPSRLAKSDEELLAAIRDGVQGKVGVMPPQKDILSEQQMRDALAYIRKQFGA